MYILGWWVRVARRGRLGNGRTYWSGRDCLIGHVFGARSRSRAARHRYGYLGRTLMTWWCWIKASYWVVLSNGNSWFTTKKATKRRVPFLVTCYSSWGFIIRYPAIAGPPTATTTIAGYVVVETLDGATMVGSSRRPPPPRPGIIVSTQ